MRRSKLGIQALAPNGRALEWIKRIRPRGAKFVIVSKGDFADWMPQISPEVFIIGRWIGDGNPDHLPWTAENGKMLADIHAEVHEVNHRRFNGFECVNEPIVYHPDAMKRLAEFQRAWAIRMKEHGISPIVGNFSIGNPQVLSADGINLMQYFRSAMEVGDHFAYHGYGCPTQMSDPRWQAMRYNELFVDAGMSMPVLITECGVDCGSKGYGYKTYFTDEQFVPQLMQFDQALQVDKKVHLATIFCMGTYNAWKTFDLTDKAAWMLGEYIIGQGDVEEEEEEEMDHPITILMPNGTLRKMEIEDYDKGVVHKEAIDAWGNEPGGMEILKAQAIASRTYGANHIKYPKHGAAAVCTTSHCQNYSEFRHPNSSRAVDETRGELITKGGQPIEAEYHACCGGIIPGCPCAESGRDALYGRDRGMCQWGGYILATRYNKTYQQILDFYYPLTPEPEPEPEWKSVEIRGTVTVEVAEQKIELPVSSTDLQVR